MEEGEGGDEGKDRAGEEQEEGQAARPLAQPRMPTWKLVEELELTHIPYRSWYIHCRNARGIAAPHRAGEEEAEEEKSAAMSSWSMDYTFLTEDFELLTSTEAEGYVYQDKAKDPLLVSSNGRVENAIRRIQAMIRTLRSC